MRTIILVFVFMVLSFWLGCAHVWGSSFDKPNPPDAGPELRWGS